MNTTTNSSSGCSILSNRTAHGMGITVTLCLVLVVSLVGNAFIALIVYKTQSMRKPINYFIVNMAMSDLLFPLIIVPQVLTMIFAKHMFLSSPFGQASCKMTSFCKYVSGLVSIQSLVQITVDRFGAVVFPLRSPLISSKMCPFFIVSTWLVAMAVRLPALFTAKLGKYNETVFCGGSFLSGNFYILAFFVLFIYIPIALLTILYSIILIKLKSQKTPGEQSVNIDEQRARRNRKVLKMAITIVVTFVLFWVPLSIFHLLFFFAPQYRFNCGILLTWEITAFLAISHCTINPLICFIFCGNYRHGLKNILRCLW